ncbi:MAG: hypothetical protein Q8K72_16270 [Acidimicrobiales bacterium]|nr:hypothetical protein [Acidimicrobiales bacterium]
MAFLFGVAVVPTHVSFGGGSLRCGTVVRPARSELGAVCDRAGANQLRAALVLTAILTALACIPFAVERRRPARYSRLWVPWGAVMLFTAVIGIAGLAMLDYSPKSVFIDL